MRKLNIHVFLGKYLQNVLHSETPHLGSGDVFFYSFLLNTHENPGFYMEQA